MQVIHLVLTVASILLALVVTKNLALAAINVTRGVVQARPDMLRQLVLGAVLGAALGLAAALRTDMSVVVLMICTGLSVVLCQSNAALLLGMQRNERWVFVVYNTMLFRRSQTQRLIEVLI